MLPAKETPDVSNRSPILWASLGFIVCLILSVALLSIRYYSVRYDKNNELIQKLAQFDNITSKNYHVINQIRAFFRTQPTDLQRIVQTSDKSAWLKLQHQLNNYLGGQFRFYLFKAGRLEPLFSSQQASNMPVFVRRIPTPSKHATLMVYYHIDTIGAPAVYYLFDAPDGNYRLVAKQSAYALQAQLAQLSAASYTVGLRSKNPQQAIRSHVTAHILLTKPIALSNAELVVTANRQFATQQWLYWLTLMGIFTVIAAIVSVFVFYLTSTQERRQARELSKREQEALLATTTLRSLGDGVIVTDINGLVLYLNPAAEAVTGWTLAEAHRQSVTKIFPASERVRAYDQHDMHPTLLQAQENVVYFDSILHREAITIHLEKSVTTLRCESAGVLGFAWVLRDLTKRLKAQEELRNAAKVFECSHEGIMLLDASEHIMRINQAFCNMTGYQVEEVVGHHQSILSPGGDEEQYFKRASEQLALTGFWQGEIWQRRKNGEVYPEWISISAVYDEEGEINSYVCIFNDITEKKLSEQKIHRLAYYDPLTELANRTLFADRLTQSLNRAKRHSTWVVLLFLDLDRFKFVNDTFGHPAGDKLLQAAAQRIRACVREEDTIARMGGDEFTIIIASVDDKAQAINAAKAVATKVLVVLAEPFAVEGHDVSVTTSIGVAMYPQDGKVSTELLRNADSAMYHAKAQGKNNFQFYAEEMNATTMERYAIESNIRQALQNNEFVVYYQPQIDLKTQQVVALEALMRWNSEKEGLVLPDHFISVAEETGLIVEVGEWVLMQACQQMQAWREQGLAVDRMCVNISGRQFKQEHFTDSLRNILAASSLPAGCLELEVTESSLILDITKTQAILAQCRDMGLKIAVDDFGTGYSSLSYLKRFPVDTLKIDGTFVSDLDASVDDAEIVTAVIAMGHSLNLRVVAEGVETAAQLRYLETKGCDVAQGFLFSEAVPANKIPALCETLSTEQ